ncbi:MAG: alpha/beta hydrolase [Candidatus Algichlamydia australiensis]|nr:alpha/beta hydrolase [Chlamydiales bacterium]
MKEVTIKTKESSIKAFFSNPPLSRGLVIFIHGKGESRFSEREQFMARTLEKGGIGYLLFDLLSDEEEREDMETEKYSKNLPFLTERVLAATRWVKEQEELKSLPLGYCGIGSGSAAALCATAIEPSIKALVLRGASSEPTESVLENIHCPTLLLVGGRDDQNRPLNEKIFEILTCKKDLKLIGGVAGKFEEMGAIEIVSLRAYNWFVVHFGIPGLGRD